MRPSLSVFSRGRRMLLTRKTLWSCCSAALLGACVSSSAIAQSAAAPEKLTDLLTICNDALQFNPEYESARASYYAAKELVPQARGKLLPPIGVLGEYDWLRPQDRECNRLNPQN